MHFPDGEFNIISSSISPIFKKYTYIYLRLFQLKLFLFTIYNNNISNILIESVAVISVLGRGEF